MCSRRGLPESGDVDILVTHPAYTDEMRFKKESNGLLLKLVQKLEQNGLVTDVISVGFMQFMGVCQLVRLILLLPLVF